MSATMTGEPPSAADNRQESPKVPASDHRQYPFAEDFDGVWHVRRDASWDPFLAGCGERFRSVHVSEYAPVLNTYGPRPRHCRGCFPVGRKRRSR